MNALSRIHETLREDGVLLDVHPAPENSRIEVWEDGQIHRLGEIAQDEDHKEIVAARSHLQAFERDGLFRTEESAVFELLEHHPTVESWEDRWEYEGYRLVAEPKLLETARALLQRPSTELVIREPVRASRLRRT